ncbi:MAG: LysM peptidoglycan-binding domain-containing protein [Pseudomonadota bacterium]
MLIVRYIAAIIIVLAFWGCAATTQTGRPLCRGAAIQELDDVRGNDKDQSETELNGSHKNGNQAQLDAALEKCQTSNELWEKGDIDGALETLDKAYILVLRVGKDADQSILQQKEDLRFAIAKKIIKVFSSRFNAANGYQKAIPLVMNEHVQKAIESFQGPEKSFFLEAYARSGQYRPAIARALKEDGLPEELSWLPMIESGFKLKAFSAARALGLWQFIASTGYKFGLERNEWIDERMDPQKSTRAAIAYLKELHSIFGDWSTSLAAYNCGENAVLKVIRNQKVNYLDNFWDLYKKLPCETASFYPRFLAVLHITANPQQFGFSLPALDKEITVEEVAIDKQIHLETIAATIGVSDAELELLNPDLRQDVTPPSPYSLKVPAGKAKPLVEKLSDIPLWMPSVPSYIVHKVRKGDSISSLASKYKASERAIIGINRIKPDQPLVQGTHVKIPSGKKLAGPDVKEPIHSSVVKDNLIEYVVEEGDTIWDIADEYNTTVKVIQSLNQLTTTHLSAGQVLVLTENPENIRKWKTIKYKVQKGDSPAAIAKRYKMKISEFLKLNRLNNSASLMPGQTLLVKAK